MIAEIHRRRIVAKLLEASAAENHSSPDKHHVECDVLPTHRIWYTGYSSLSCRGECVARFQPLVGDLFQARDRDDHSNRKLLRLHGIKASMSRKGNCLDNAPMESFFGSLKT